MFRVVLCSAGDDHDPAELSYAPTMEGTATLAVSSDRASEAGEITFVALLPRYRYSAPRVGGVVEGMLLRIPTYILFHLITALSFCHAPFRVSMPRPESCTSDARRSGRTF